MSKISIAVLLACASLFAGAADESLTAQQEKMKSCNRVASDRHLEGDARQEFMSDCLNKDSGGELTAQQERMDTCNRQARDLRGDERRAFMSECLRADRSGRRSSAAGGR